MTSMSSVSPAMRVAGITVSLLIVLVAVAAPAAQDKARTVVPVVAPATLEPLLPAALEGWTKVRSTSNRVTDGCAYSFAETVYANGDAKLRVTVADTGFDTDSLTTLATIVLSFPAGHTEKIPPDTTISRVTYRDNDAATMWNPTSGEAEFTVVVGDRFVVKVEGTHVTGLDTLRAALDKIDLKKVTELNR